MAAVANNPEFAKKSGVPKAVGQDFMDADKGKTFRVGGAKTSKKEDINKQKTNRGDRQLPNAMLNKYIGHKDGGVMKAVDSKKNPGLAKLPTEVRNKMGYMKKGGMAHDDAKADMKMDKSQDKSMIKKAFKQHDMQEHKGGKGTKLALKNGGAMHKMPDGSMMAGKKHGMSHGGMATKKMASGGKVGQLSKADGVATKGKSKGTMVKMSHGGKC